MNHSFYHFFFTSGSYFFLFQTCILICFGPLGTRLWSRVKNDFKRENEGCSELTAKAQSSSRRYRIKSFTV